MNENAFDEDDDDDDFDDEDDDCDNDRVLTLDEARHQFLSQIQSMVGYCARLENKTLRKRLELLAFCILVMIDGEDTVGPYSLHLITESGKLTGNLSDGELHSRWSCHYSVADK